MTIIIAMLKGFLKLIYLFLKLIPTKKNKVVFLSRQSSEISTDFNKIKDNLLAYEPDTDIVFVCNRMEKGWLSKISFAFDMLRSMYHLATSRVAVLDSYWPAVSLLNHKNSLFVIQIWHAIGKIKKSGYQTLDKAGGRGGKIANALAMHKNYDIIIAGGKAWNPYYCASFNVPERILKNIGLPRIDYLLECKDINRDKFFEEYPETAGKEIILYAPTFRRGYKSRWHELLDYIDYNKQVLIIKGHPNEKIETGIKGTLLCEDFKAVDLLAACDYLITDYSAIALEAAVLNKKTYYYIYDFDEYNQKNGLNLNIKEVMPNCSFEKAEELMRAIAKDNYPVAEFEEYKRKYLPENLGTSTDEIRKIIVEKLRNN